MTADGAANREVTEDLSKANLQEKPKGDLELEEPNEMSIYSQAGNVLSQYVDAKEWEEQNPESFGTNCYQDIEVKIMTEKLMKIREKKGDTCSIDEIVTVYCKTSGDADRTYEYIVNKKKVPMWTPLEDMALMEPDTSLEYLTLL